MSCFKSFLQGYHSSFNIGTVISWIYYGVPILEPSNLYWLCIFQIIELQLPSFFNNFDPRAAAANFPSSNWTFPSICTSAVLLKLLFVKHYFNRHHDDKCVWENEISGVQAYLAGLTFALAASPCSTPVLATLLGYVAASRV